MKLRNEVALLERAFVGFALPLAEQCRMLREDTPKSFDKIEVREWIKKVKSTGQRESPRNESQSLM